MHHIAPKYILAGGCVLALGASFSNVGFLLNTGASISHLTGDISRLAVDIANNDAKSVQNLALVSSATFGFIVGAIGSGIMLHHPQLELEKPYGRIVTGIGVLLVLAYLISSYSWIVSIGIGGFACGMQNALATKYRGLVLRTTHVTGLLTDMGVMIGMKMRGHNVESWRLGVPLFLTLSFFAGAFLGGVAVLRYNLPWLAIIGSAYVFGGIVWSLMKRKLFNVARDKIDLEL